MERLRQLIHEIHRRSLWQVMGIYLLASWAVLQVVDTLGGALRLPEWLEPMALVLLIIGLPIVLATAFIQEGGPGRDAGDEEVAGAPAEGSPAEFARACSSTEQPWRDVRQWPRRPARLCLHLWNCWANWNSGQ